MFLDIKSRLQETQLSELLSYSVFPDEIRLIHTIEDYQSNSNFEIYGYEAEGVVIGVLGVRMSEESIAETDEDSVDFYRNVGFTVVSLGERYLGIERFQCIYHTNEV